MSQPGALKVWIAYYSDRSGLAFFDEEIEALRYAIERSGMKVAPINTGDDVWEQVDR